MRHPSPTIALVNAWHDDNRGDSAITIATLDMLRQRFPAAELRLASLVHPSDPGYPSSFRNVRQVFPEVEIVPAPCPPLRNAGGLRGALGGAAWAGRVGAAYARRPGRRAPLGEALEGTDLVVMEGGSNVFDSGRGVGLGFARLAQVLFPAWAAQRAGIPTVFLGHTIGPLASRRSRQLAARVLGASSAVVCREPASVEAVRGLGAPAHVVRAAPDMAFALRPDHSKAVDQVLLRHGLRGRRFAVLVARRHPYRGEESSLHLVASLAATARRLVREDVVERVAVVAHTVGPTDVEDDRPISRLLATAIGDGTPVIDDELTPMELAALYGQASLVVSVRLHGAILALVGGTPAVAISYFTDKTAGVMGTVGMADQVLSYDDVTEESLFPLAMALARPEARHRAAAAASRCRQQLDEELDRLAATLVDGTQRQPPALAGGLHR